MGWRMVETPSFTKADMANRAAPIAITITPSKNEAASVANITYNAGRQVMAICAVVMTAEPLKT